MEPVVSIIIPVYNAAEYLDQCLDSALAQVDGRVEVICIDDGSSDGSVELIKERAAQDDRISLTQQQHQGAGAARNKGIERAMGKYLYFLDSDDFIDGGILDKAVGVMERHGADIVVFQVRQIDMRTGSEQFAHWAYKSDNIPAEAFAPEEMADKLFNTFLSWAHNKLFRHEFVRENKLRFQEIFRTNDLFFVDSAMATASRIAVLPEMGINYRANQASSSQGTNSLYPLDFYKAFYALKRELEENGLWDTFSKSFLNEAVHSCIYNLRSQKTPGAFTELYNFLRDEGFNNLGIAEASKDIFFNRDDYRKYLAIRDTSSEELVLLGFANLESRVDHKSELDQLRRIKNSKPYRIGRALTFVPRRVKRLLGR